MSVPRPRSAVGGAAAVAAAVALLCVLSPASARPVRTGRYVEIPYGISEAHPWGTEGGNSQRNGRVGAAAPPTAPTQLWEKRLRLGRLSPPAIMEDGTLFLAGAAGVSGIDPNGQVHWTLRLGFVTGTPSVTPTGEIAVGTSGGALLQITPEGDQRARTLAGGGVRGSPLVLADGSLVVAVIDQGVQRFDAEGRQLFRTPVSQTMQGPPVWSRNGEILVPVGEELVALSTRGDLRARTSLGAVVVAGPAVADDGTIWVLTIDGGLHQLSPELAVRSRTEVGGQVAVTTTIAVGSDGAVRVPTRDGALVCVGPNGTVRWRLEGEGSYLGGVALDRHDIALTVSDRGRLLAVDPDGNVRWRAEVGTRTDAAPVLGPDGTVYVATVRGTLQAWR